MLLEHRVWPSLPHSSSSFLRRRLLGGPFSFSVSLHSSTFQLYRSDIHLLLLSTLFSPVFFHFSCIFQLPNRPTHAPALSSSRRSESVMSANNRASLLANLRTGGVRSMSSNVPQTAAPTVTSFQLPDAPMTAAPGGSFNDNMYSFFAPNQAQMQQQAQMYQMQVLQAEIMKMQVSFQLNFPFAFVRSPVVQTLFCSRFLPFISSILTPYL